MPLKFNEHWQNGTSKHEIHPNSRYATWPVPSVNLSGDLKASSMPCSCYILRWSPVNSDSIGELVGTCKHLSERVYRCLSCVLFGNHKLGAVQLFFSYVQFSQSKYYRSFLWLMKQKLMWKSRENPLWNKIYFVHLTCTETAIDLQIVCMLAFTLIYYKARGGPIAHGKKLRALRSAAPGVYFR